MPPEVRFNAPFAPKLSLPPGFRLVSLREVGDSFAFATEKAPELGAATLVHVGRFDLAWGDQFAAIIGAFWPVGRIMYGLGYAKAPEKRGPGFGLSFLTASILLLGALAGAVLSLV